MNHYFTNSDNIKSDIYLVEFNILNKDYSLYSDNGVFSKKELDYGTRLLLETIPINKMKGNVLDLGCGYGPIGIVIATENSNCNVDMVDVNLRAIHLSERNNKKMGLNNNIFESDAYSKVNNKYKYIITNPPIRAGKKKVYDFLFNAKDHFDSEGELWFVMRKDQGVKSTLTDLEIDYKVSIEEKKKGFYVVCAKKLNKPLT